MQTRSCHYFTSLGLSWDGMLKMMDIKLELMMDIDMYQFIEKGMRGVISYIANRHGQANKKYMKDYDKNKPSKYIISYPFECLKTVRLPSICNRQDVV